MDGGPPYTNSKCSSSGEVDLAFTLSIQQCQHGLIAALLLLCKAGHGADISCWQLTGLLGRHRTGPDCTTFQLDLNANC